MARTRVKAYRRENGRFVRQHTRFHTTRRLTRKETKMLERMGVL